LPLVTFCVVLTYVFPAVSVGTVAVAVACVHDTDTAIRFPDVCDAAVAARLVDPASDVPDVVLVSAIAT
jgi:hypothetical protein